MDDAFNMIPAMANATAPIRGSLSVDFIHYDRRILGAKGYKIFLIETHSLLHSSSF